MGDVVVVVADGLALALAGVVRNTAFSDDRDEVEFIIVDTGDEELDVSAQGIAFKDDRY